MIETADHRLWRSEDMGVMEDLQPGTLVDCLRDIASRLPERRAFSFLTDGETEDATLTYGELDRQARAIAAELQGLGQRGARALMLYPPGLDFISAFFGCLYADIVAVPLYPPHPRRLEATLPRVRAVAEDSSAALVLTTEAILSSKDLLSGIAPDLAALHWVATDRVQRSGGHDWVDPAIEPDGLAFLQYTSGSTAAPKGVMLTHENLLANIRLITAALGLSENHHRCISWLPMYHDMGLIGTTLTPVCVGSETVFMSPIAFARKPLAWLRAISRYRGTISASPNFAFDLCVQRTTPQQRAELDLSSWRVALCGAEPVRAETLDAFAQAFASSGFRRESFRPCYGLAEATLLVSETLPSHGRFVRRVDGHALERGRVVDANENTRQARALTACGRAGRGQRFVIVDPESRIECSPGEVGEIWISSPSVAKGYWNRPAQTRETFGARLAGSDDGPFLRSGDLGFLMDGELFVTSRLKDLLIIRGRNIAPQDIESTVERCFVEVRSGCGAAFAVEREGEDRLVVVFELDPTHREQADAVAAAIHDTVAAAHGLATQAVKLIEARTIPKTSSGKIQRFACREGFLSGDLDVVGSFAPSKGGLAG